MKKGPVIEDLTLDEIYELEAKHPPLVGSRTSVFLEPDERAGVRALRGRLRGRATASEAFTLHEEKAGWPSVGVPKKKPGVRKNQAAS